MERGLWQDGQLRLAGLPPLALAVDRRESACPNGVTGAMAHAFSRWAWSQATFDPAGEDMDRRYRRAGRAHGGGQFARLDRVAVAFPPTDYNRIGTAFTSLCGTLVRIEIERATGALRIAKAYSVLECGRRSCRKWCSARRKAASRWASATPCSRRCRRSRTVPATAKWNLGDYLVARGSDLPLHDLEIEVLPPLTRRAPKGMAEVVMIPVVPALLNAIFDATGRRFQSLPVTAGHAQGSACVTTLALTINGRAYGPMEVRDDLTMNDFLREYLGMTGTKFGCGAAQCLSCAVIVDDPDGTSHTSPTCIVPAASFDGKSIRTVEGHARNGELTILQKAFVEHFAFQCGYCTAGFLNEGQVLLERLARNAGGAGRSRGDHRRGARRPPLPLHRLHQIPRGGARCDPSRSRTLSRPMSRAMLGEKPNRSFIPLASLVFAGALVADVQPPQSPSSGLRSPESFATIVDASRRSQALFTELGKVLTHPRCLNCHPVGDRPRQGEHGRLHQPPVARGPTASVSTPYVARFATRAPISTPAGSRATPNGTLPPSKWLGMANRCTISASRSRTRRAMAAALSADLTHHIGDDTLVGWAWAPGFGREPAPGTQKEAGALVEAWVKTGAACPD